MVVKSYRGLLEHGGQDKIRLTTTDGRIGYRIVKFQTLPENPYAAADKECIFKIYKTDQSTIPGIDGVVNFSDGDLLAVAIYSDSDGSAAPITQTSEVAIFDQEMFNQDIYITYVDKHGTQSANYYFELEQIKLTTIRAEQLIVKSLRGEVWTRP